MLHEHRVLTSTQIRQLAFPSTRSANQRLLELYRWRLLDRFQPFLTRGSAPMHYVLDVAGAAVLAAEHGLDIKDLAYRREQAIGIAHSLRLAHTVGVNAWFTTLVAHARHHAHAQLTTWWSETRCARLFGDLVRPDGYGRWASHGHLVEFFLEYDLGTEPTTVVAGKLSGYAALAAATDIATPVLIWIPSTRRETAVRRALDTTWRRLDNPETVPVATAAADLCSDADPAADVWLPLGNDSRRRRLADLSTAWQHLDDPPTTGSSAADPGVSTQGPGHLSVPDPMPPELKDGR